MKNTNPAPIRDLVARAARSFDSAEGFTLRILAAAMAAVLLVQLSACGLYVYTVIRAAALSARTEYVCIGLARELFDASLRMLVMAFGSSVLFDLLYKSQQ